MEVEDFLACAERVARGGSALDPQVVAQLLAGWAADRPLAALTDRERSVLVLMAQGLSNVGIARPLFLFERTVEARVRHLMAKLHLPDGAVDHRRVLAVLTYLASATGA